jgi:hypothetical protein
MTKDIYFVGRMFKATKIRIFGRNFAIVQKEDEESGLSERIRAKYRI